MLLLLSLVILLGLLCFIAQKRFEQIIAPFVAAIIIACFPLAMMGRLELFVYLTCSTALAMLVWVLVLCIQKKIKPSSLPRLLFTPGFVCFVLLATFFYIGSAPRVVWWGDDIRYWAMQPKSLFLSGGILNGQMNLSPGFSTYTPGMPLFQWIGLTAYGEWNEGILFFMLYLFELAFILPLTEKITWKKAYWMPLFMVFAVVMPTLLSTSSYSVLSVDTALGLCFGYVLCQLWQLREPTAATPFRLVCVVLSLCMLVLLKQTGLLLLVLAVGFLLFGIKSTDVRIKPMRIFCLFTPALLLVLCWYIYCFYNSLSGIHASALSQNVSAFFSGEWQPPIGFDQLIPKIWSSFSAQLPLFPYLAIVEIPYVYKALFFCVAPMLLIPFAHQKSRDMRRLCPWILMVFLFELIVLYVSFLTIFYSETSEYVGASLPQLPLLIERYFCPVVFGLGLWMISLVINNLHSNEKQKQLWLTIAAVVVMALFGDWQAIGYNLIPQNYEQQQQDHFVELLREQNFWVDELENPETAIVLYGIDEFQTEPEKWQYALAPIKLVYSGATELSKDDFISLLRTNSVTHVVFLDSTNAIYEAAIQFTPDMWLDTYVPYSISWENEMPFIQ